MSMKWKHYVKSNLIAKKRSKMLHLHSERHFGVLLCEDGIGRVGRAVGRDERPEVHDDDDDADEDDDDDDDVHDVADDGKAAKLAALSRNLADP